MGPTTPVPTGIEGNGNGSDGRGGSVDEGGGGGGALVDGAGSLVDGAGSLVDGAGSLVDGAGSLVDGGGALVDGGGGGGAVVVVGGSGGGAGGVVVVGAAGEAVAFGFGDFVDGCLVLVGDGFSAAPMNGMWIRRFAVVLDAGKKKVGALDLEVATGFTSAATLGAGLNDGSGAPVAGEEGFRRSACCGKLLAVVECGPCATTIASAARTPSPAAVTPIFSQSVRGS